MTSKCYWITGLLATGKTTFLTLLVNHFRSTVKQIMRLDGDKRRKFLSIEAYTREERIALGMCYSRLCHLIST